METQITNPSGALQPVTDYTTYKDANGVPVQYHTVVSTFRANEAISAGQVVIFVAATATVPLSVGVLPASASAAQKVLLAGVALSNASTGQAVRVATSGIAVVKTEGTVTAAVAAGTYAIVKASSNTAGNIDSQSSAVAGGTLGIFLGAVIGSTNTAAVNITRS